MSTPSLKATLRLESTDVLTNSVNFTVAATEQIKGDKDFQSISIPAAAIVSAFGPSLSADSSNTVYFYAQAASTNVGSVEVWITDLNNIQILVATLRPADFIWMPLAVKGSNVTVALKNLDVTNRSLVNLFYGYRG